MGIVKISREKTGERIRALMREHQLAPIDIQKELDLYAASTVYRWIQGKSLPGTNRLYQLSQLFGVDIGDILVLEEPIVLQNWKTKDAQELMKTPQKSC